MAKSKDVKHVIILDGKKKDKRSGHDETDEWLSEITNSIEKDTYDSYGHADAVREAALKRIAELSREADDENEDKYDEDRDRTGRIDSGKPLSRRKNRKKRRLMICLAGSVAVLITVTAGAVRAVNNNYKTPVRIYEEYLNRPEYTGEEMSEAYGNRLADKQLKRLRELLRGYEDYNTSLNASSLKSREAYENNRELYGDDFRYTVTVDSVERLEPKQVAALKTEFKGIIGDISVSSLARSGNQELTDAVNDVIRELTRSGLTAGYHLYCTQKVSGSYADGPVSGIVTHPDFIVVKINGRWVLWDGIYDILRMAY